MLLSDVRVAVAGSARRDVYWQNLPRPGASS
ncbi:hypothetical protein BJ979_001089 [Schumannella luteola]|uniref:Uncharacterized protein n=1 Tax=Schumannella luteola TaxID=472059 RepID=A0A852Y7W4_9MICO|nr:hypothetical protein [Schumannella luteola]